MAKKNSIQRFQQIVKVLAYYGFGYIIDNKIKNKSSPQNLRKAFEELGPTFIKIGQILSTRPDILPAEYIVELQKLQDSAPSVKYEEIESLFYSEFNKNIENCFLSFDKIPIASASIAQAHRAILKDGECVIVKIQRPHIKEDMELDLSILRKLIHLTRTRFQYALINPEEAFEEILSSTRRELNFKYEASNIEMFSKLNSEVRFTGTPRVFRDLSTKRILTMEFIDGIKINDKDTLHNEGYDLNDIGKKLALSYFKQVFEDGFFHGDPHPGNLLIKDGKIYYIDFGIMGNLSNSLREILNDIVIAVVFKDIDKMVSCLFSMGIRKGYINRNRLYDDIDYIFNSYLSVTLENLKMSQLLQDIFDAAKRNNIGLPKDLTLLIRGIVIIEGVVADISPDIKILDVAIPYVKSTNKFNLFPPFNELLIGSYTLARDMKEIPLKTLRLLNTMLDGRFKIRFELKSFSKSIGELNKMVNRLVFAIIVSSIIIGSSLILNTNIGPKVYNVSIIGITGFLAAAFLGLWLLISILRSGKL